MFLNRCALTVGLVFAMSACCWADPVACPSDSLANYKANYTTFSPCSVGELKFKAFDFAKLSSAGTLTAAGINVSPYAPNGLNFFTNYFNGTFLTPERYLITYIVDPAPIVVGDELTLDPPVGAMKVTRYLCTDDLFSVPGNLNDAPTCLTNGTLYTLQADGLDSTPTILLSDSVVFPTPAAFVSVWMVIDLEGTISGFEGLLSDHEVVPEPGTLAFVGAMLLAGAVRLRRRT